MTMMIDRNPEGRDTGEGLVDAVEDKSARELLMDLLKEIRLLRLAMVRRGTALDLGDLSELEAIADPLWVEGD